MPPLQSDLARETLKDPYRFDFLGLAEEAQERDVEMMPSALQLFADGSLPRVGGGPVEVAVGVYELGPMVLAEVRCGGANHEVTVLVFTRASRAATVAAAPTGRPK